MREYDDYTLEERERRNEPETFEGERKTATDAAILVDIDGDEHWLPLSQVEVEKVGGRFSGKVRVTMPYWLAIEKGLL